MYTVSESGFEMATFLIMPPPRNRDTTCSTWLSVYFACFLYLSFCLTGRRPVDSELILYCVLRCAMRYRAGVPLNLAVSIDAISRTCLDSQLFERHNDELSLSLPLSLPFPLLLRLFISFHSVKEVQNSVQRNNYALIFIQKQQRLASLIRRDINKQMSPIYVAQIAPF